MTNHGNTPDQPASEDATRYDPEALLGAGLDDATAGRGPPIAEMAEHFPAFELLAVLGHGGMGVVYRARQKSLDREVALKVLTPPPGDADAFAERFQREARALARLEHPNIVRVYEHGTTDGLHYLVMELVQGVNLRHAMSDGGMTPDQALTIVPKICDALQFAHEQGVVHRDIKPENVLLAKDGTVKIADFGLARMLEGEQNTRLTRRDQVMGTLHYMAPEQFESPTDVDHRADIYSLGVVLYEMLTGELPIGRFDLPSERVQVDVKLDRVVLRALAKQRDRRYQAAVDLGSDVDMVKSGGDLTADPAGARASEPPAGDAQPAVVPRRSTLAALSLLAVPFALAILVAAGVIAELRGDELSVNDHFRIWGLGGFLAAVAGIVGMTAGAVAAIRIGQSRGHLTGRGFAISAILLPILASPIVVPLAYMATSESRPADQPPRPVGTELNLRMGGSSTPSERIAISSSIRRLIDDGLAHALAGANYSTLEHVRTLYDPKDMPLLERMSPAELEQKGRAGELGLPLLAASSLRFPLAEYTRIGVVDVSDDRASATVQIAAENGHVTVHVSLATKIGNYKWPARPKWLFRAMPVSEVVMKSYETVMSGVVVRGRPHHMDDTQLSEFVDRVRALSEKGISHALAARGAEGLDDIYAPDEMKAFEHVQVDHLEELRKHRRVGLAFMGTDSVPEPLEEYDEIVSIDFEPSGKTATVELRADTSALRFRCVEYRAPATSKPEIGPGNYRGRVPIARRWGLAALPVEVVADLETDER